MNNEFLPLNIKRLFLKFTRYFVMICIHIVIASTVNIVIINIGFSDVKWLYTNV